MYSPRIKESVNNLSRKDIEGFVFGNCGHSFSKTEKNLSVGQQILNNSSKKYSASTSNILQNKNQCN